MNDSRHYMYMEDENFSCWTKFRIAAFIISAAATLVSMFALIICAVMAAYSYCCNSRSPGLTYLIVIASVFAGSLATFWATHRSLEKGCFKGMGKELP